MIAREEQAIATKIRAHSLSRVTQIMAYLIPFGTTTALMLGAFAEMYFKSVYGTYVCSIDVDASDFCRLDSSFLKVYTMFVAGIDGSLLTTETDRNLLILTVFYAFLFVVVMLTVLVAVIFDAWGIVSPEGEKHFWRYRHEFLTETTETKFLSVYLGLSRPNRLDSLESHLTSVFDRFCSRPERASESRSVRVKLVETLLYLTEGVYLAIWFFLGLLSAGMLWPKVFRRKIFTIGDEEEEQELEDQTKEEIRETRERLSLHQRQLEEAHHAIDSLKEAVTKLRDLAASRAT